uniref:Uncharacterized protein LOC104214048 n=1 Tax=Nicotiana sylvestris TaxID=4096 RepID=A0A1U7V6C3_NICSY|nr:PREDICTED: uncharacterized protein LOC104214048 [Nicotiana sylvestris]
MCTWGGSHPWLAEMLAAPGPLPPWITAGVPIQKNTLNFEAKGWQTFVYSRLDLCQNVTYLPNLQAVLVASIMAGYPINVGVVMSANISMIARQRLRSDGNWVPEIKFDSKRSNLNKGNKRHRNLQSADRRIPSAAAKAWLGLKIREMKKSSSLELPQIAVVWPHKIILQSRSYYCRPQKSALRPECLICGPQKDCLTAAVQNCAAADLQFLTS